MKANSYFKSSSLSPATALLLAILAVALGLRIWGVWFGLPFLFHNDEGFEVVRALQLGAGEFDFSRIGKGGYFYLLFVEYGLLFIALFLAGVVGSANEFAELYLKDPSAFYLVGRATTAVIGTVTIYLVYRLGRLAYSTLAGLAAAALLAANVLHSYLSHFVIVDIPMTCLATASLYFAVKIAQNGSRRDYWWAAFLAALATTTKIPAGLLIIPLTIAHSYCLISDGSGPRGFFGRRFWQAAAIFLVTYLVLTPGMLLYGGEVFWSVLGQFGISSGVGAAAGEAALEFELDERAMYASTNLFVFYLRALVNSMTLPVFALGIAGLGYALWRHRPADVVLASFAIATYLVVSLSADIHQFFPRYILPAIPVLALLSGRLLDAVLSVVSSKGSHYRPVIASLFVLALVAWPVYEIVASNRILLMEDTRATAKEWIDANIPEGSKIFIEGHRTRASGSTVPLQNSVENIQESIEYYRGSNPGRVKYFQTLLKVQSGATYDLLGVGPWELQELQYYKDLGVQYLILRPEAYPGSRVRYEWENFVDDIRADPDVDLVKRFEPLAGAERAPTIEVYRVNSNVAGSQPAEVTTRRDES